MATLSTNLTELACREHQRATGWDIKDLYEFNCLRIQFLRKEIRRQIRVQRIRRTKR